MRGELSAGKVILTPETEQEEVDLKLKGYGRSNSGEIELSLEEAAFLLDKGKLTLMQEDSELSFNEFLKRALDTSPTFMDRYLVYTDLKERGYAVKTGGLYFWLYTRGARSGEKPAMYFICILSERDSLSLLDLDELFTSARNMRKELILAVLDEESDITYYEVKEPGFGTLEDAESTEVKAKASLVGDRAVLWDAEFAEKLHKSNFYGKLTKDNRLLLSLVEAAYLIAKNQLEIGTQNGAKMSFKQFMEYVSATESDFLDRYAVYADLRARGLMVKTGFKFGSHFRVYKAEQHSLYLVHVLPNDYVFSITGLARAVRLAHGVKKRMIFAYIINSSAMQQIQEKQEQKIKYIDIGRMKL